LVVAAAKTGKVINIKKGQFLAPWDVKNIVKKAEDSCNHSICVTERGTSFGYNTLVTDMRGLKQMAKDTGYPVIFDATHSVQQPGGLGGTTGGQREFAPVLARAAVAVGIAGIFIETHENPDKALSDGPNSIALKDMERVISELMAFDKVNKSIIRDL
jgi:2-dehydro-3-deoxyphosphooctonate aldolase (KDO 8-P synthase)